MGTYDFNAMFAEAEEAGFTSELLPADVYEAEVASTNTGQTSTKKDQVGVRFKVLSGPKAGSSVWLNIVFPDGSNKNAYAPFFRKLGWFGVDKAFLSTNPSLEQIAARCMGQRKRISVTIREHNGKHHNDVAVQGDLSTEGGPSVPAPPAAPPATAPAAPQAAPATETPATPAAPAATPSGTQLPPRSW